MAETPKLDAHHQATVQRILGHPVSHNIEWHDVLSLLGQVGSVIEEPDGLYQGDNRLGDRNVPCAAVWRY